MTTKTYISGSDALVINKGRVERCVRTDENYTHSLSLEVFSEDNVLKKKTKTSINYLKPEVLGFVPFKLSFDGFYVVGKCETHNLDILSLYLRFIVFTGNKP